MKFSQQNMHKGGNKMKGMSKHSGKYGYGNKGTTSSKSPKVKSVKGYNSTMRANKNASKNTTKSSKYKNR